MIAIISLWVEKAFFVKKNTQNLFQIRIVKVLTMFTDYIVQISNNYLEKVWFQQRSAFICFFFIYSAKWVM